jgi:hypothetical protein
MELDEIIISKALVENFSKEFYRPLEFIDRLPKDCVSYGLHHFVIVNMLSQKKWHSFSKSRRSDNIFGSSILTLKERDNFTF